MANSGDCARIVDTAGCEVFSVCWGSNNLNNLIYFSGSGADDVWYFNGGNPNLQSNWTEGCADLNACGANDQSPGQPNNLTNIAYVAQFNNNCMPITPLIASAIATNGSCICGGSATASVSGSLPIYLYEWYDASYTSIGQDSITAIGLCDGTYHVIITSGIGCIDTATVIILNGTMATNAGLDSTFTLCADTTSIDLFDYLNGTPDLGGSWNGPSTLNNGDHGTLDVLMGGSGSYIYTVSGGSTCPSSSAIVNITLETLPNPGLSSSITLCSSESPIGLFGQMNGSPQNGGTWSGPSPLNNGSIGVFDPTLHTPGTYYYTVQGFTCSPDSASMSVTVIPFVTPVISPVDSAYCLLDTTITLTSTPSIGLWSSSCGNCIGTTTGIFDIFDAGVGTHEVIYNAPGVCGGSDTVLIVVKDSPDAQIFPGFIEDCPYDTAFVWATGENLLWFNDIMDTSQVLQDSGYFYVTANNICGSDTATMQIVWNNNNGDCYVPSDPISWMLFPNVFTPNSDFVNDLFTIKEFQNVTNLKVDIFNRWGQHQGGWEGFDGYWSGLKNDIEVTEGTYFFIASALDWENKPYTVKGHFLLVR